MDFRENDRGDWERLEIMTSSEVYFASVDLASESLSHTKLK